MNITLTDEQTACIAATKGSKASLLINALAGAAKTTTLCHIASALPLAPTLCLAFNKKVAVEMGTRMPSFVTCQTLNSLGHGVWSRSLGGKRLIVDTNKTYKLVTEIFAGKKRNKDEQDTFGALLKASRLAKAAGYVPEAFRKLGTSLIELDELIGSIAREGDVDPDGKFLSQLDKILETSIALAYQAQIDFDDQIYMPTLFGGSFPEYTNVLIDEAQDLSPLNHETLRRMKFDRLIAVGDPHQAIYAFRGASHTSMEELKTRFHMQEQTLSTSFRCPRTVVRNAQWRVPHMRYPDWAKEGRVEKLETWSPGTIPESSAILCRNNAPLFRTAMRLIRAGRGIKVHGSDIGAGLIKLLDKMGAGDLTSHAVLLAIDRWETAELAKAHSGRVATITDKAECLRVFAAATSSLDEAKAYAKAIFAASGSIQLMTGHGSKGGEWDTVFILDVWLVPSKYARAAAELGDESDLIQEMNLKYVMETRAKQSLYYINTEEYEA